MYLRRRNLRAGCWSATSESCIGTQPSWLCWLAVVPTAWDFAGQDDRKPSTVGVKGKQAVAKPVDCV